MDAVNIPHIVLKCSLRVVEEVHPFCAIPQGLEHLCGHVSSA